MVNPALLEYVRRRIAYGDSLSDIKQDLQSAGYSIDAIDMAFQQINKGVMVTEKVLSVSPVAIPGTSKIELIKDISKRYWIFNEETFNVGRAMGLWGAFSEVQVVASDNHADGSAILLVK